ncbi:hypothetical protein V6N13_043132 [Hibiscus sabdariffa]
MGKDFEEHLANLEKGHSEMKKDLEEKVDKAQQATHEHISQTQNDMLSKLMVTLVETDSKSAKRSVINPGALV